MKRFDADHTRGPNAQSSVGTSGYEIVATGELHSGYYAYSVWAKAHCGFGCLEKNGKVGLRMYTEHHQDIIVSLVL